jgi:hypothetical protein
VCAAGWASLIALLAANNRLNAAYLLKESFGRLQDNAIYLIGIRIRG